MEEFRKMRVGGGDVFTAKNTVSPNHGDLVLNVDDVSAFERQLKHRVLIAHHGLPVVRGRDVNPRHSKYCSV